MIFFIMQMCILSLVSENIYASGAPVQGIQHNIPEVVAPLTIVQLLHMQTLKNHSSAFLGSEHLQVPLDHVKPPLPQQAFVASPTNKATAGTKTSSASNSPCSTYQETSRTVKVFSLSSWSTPTPLVHGASRVSRVTGLRVSISTDDDSDQEDIQPEKSSNSCCSVQ